MTPKRTLHTVLRSRGAWKVVSALVLVCGLLLNGRGAVYGALRGATLKTADILLVDHGANTLVLVDLQTGRRTLISHFSNPAQGNLSNGAFPVLL
jgi:hypothetical protein